MYATALAGEAVELHADRALYWPRERTLFIADVHLGKAATLRAGGIPLPRGATGNDLARIGQLFNLTRAVRLVVLGDFLHARSGRVAALDQAFRAWRESWSSVSIALVRGNHDARAGDPPAGWGIECVGEARALPPFVACHAPVAPPSGYALCGHVHPGVVLGGAVDTPVRLPCFVLGSRRAILPAFGRLTGLAEVALAEDDRVVAIAGQKLFAVPRLRSIG
jgi:uncharacterized protein